MLALVNTPNGNAPDELRELPEPQPARNEALVEVRAFSLNRGELRSFQNNEEGWGPWDRTLPVSCCARPRMAAAGRRREHVSSR